ncbi:MAG: PhzF family phenazine biosynthesis protein [Planctomycetota bacterium]
MVAIVQVDSFTDRPFAGNPAAVCVLDQPRDDAWLQAVAAEMNLSETAFLWPREPGAYDLRWFTPTVEVSLCGHATLASAHVLWEGRETGADTLRFATRSGELRARREGTWITLDFPATPARPIEPPTGLLEALGLTEPPHFIGRNDDDLLLELDSEAAVRAVAPDFGRLGALDLRGVMVTARAEATTQPGGAKEADFVSRFFCPSGGVDEDPVTGSAHCTLGPHWAERVGRDEVTGYQASTRGGFVRVRVRGDRVDLIGQTITVLRAELADGALAPPR